MRIWKLQNNREQKDIIQGGMQGLQKTVLKRCVNQGGGYTMEYVCQKSAQLYNLKVLILSDTSINWYLNFKMEDLKVNGVKSENTVAQRDCPSGGNKTHRLDEDEAGPASERYHI